MNKDKCKATIYGVFLLISIIIIFLLLYLLIFENNKKVEINEVDNNTNLVIKTKELEDQINIVYSNAYDYINSDNFVSNYETVNNYECALIDVKSLSNYFTDKVLDNIRNSLYYQNNNYYDCNEMTDSFIVSLNLASIFGSTDQHKRTLEIKAMSDDYILASGQNAKSIYYDADNYPFYIVFRRINNKWLIDSFE